nr:photosystem II protein N [Euglena agilis]WCH63289.1 photosystem II protein N [Euglena agilis]
MELMSLLCTTFIGCALISITLYSIYVGFGPKGRNFRDPFEEHED